MDFLAYGGPNEEDPRAFSKGLENQITEENQISWLIWEYYCLHHPGLA